MIKNFGILFIFSLLIMIFNMIGIFYIYDNKFYENITFTQFYLILLAATSSYFLIYFIYKKLIIHHLKFFKAFSLNLKNLEKGRHITFETSKKMDPTAKKELLRFNKIIEGWQNTSDEIENKLGGLLGYQKNNSNDLTSPNLIINDLHDLYQFKKEIELDNTVEEIYSRLIQIIEKKFSVKNFSFFVVNNETNKLKVIKHTSDSISCINEIKNSSNNCRTIKTQNDVNSIKFHNTCSCFKNEEKSYYCFNVNIDKKNSILIHFETNVDEELRYFKNVTPYIKTYFREAKDKIEILYLMKSLQLSAYTDELTKCYNRKYLDLSVKKLLPRLNRNEQKMGILMLDMDHFKSVNDNYGHDVGDLVLITLSNILKDSVRESDLVVRFGGEEFVILLVGIHNEEEGMKLAENIRRKVENTKINVGNGETLKKTISSGITMFPDDTNKFEEAMKFADLALYYAKENGRNQVKKFTTNLLKKD